MNCCDDNGMCTQGKNCPAQALPMAPPVSNDRAVMARHLARDAAIQADLDYLHGLNSGLFERRRHAAALRQQIQSNPQHWGYF